MGMTNDIPIEGYRGFASWKEVLTWTDLGEPLYYKAPMDLVPVRVKTERRGNVVAVIPLGRSFDPFLADEGHKERFLCDDAAPSSEVELESDSTRAEPTRVEGGRRWAAESD